MLTLVTDMLDVSTIESGHMSIEKEPIELNEIVAQQVALAELSAARKSLSLHQELEPLETIQGDPRRIAQLIDNLLSNAIKFSEPKTTIHINTHQDDQAIKLIVKDEGPGIAKDELEQLLIPFSKGTATPTGDEITHSKAYC